MNMTKSSDRYKNQPILRIIFYFLVSGNSLDHKDQIHKISELETRPARSFL